MKPLTFPKNVRIPSGKEASLRDMQEYGRVLQNFVKKTEIKLLDETDTKQYNMTVEYLNHLADHYNRELKVFKKAQQQRQLAALSSLCGTVRINF